MLHRVLALALALSLVILLLPLTAPLPASVLLPRGGGLSPAGEDEPAPSEETAPAREAPEEALPPPEPEGEEAPSPVPETVTLLLADGTVETLALEDYLWGVVAAEMPAAFQPEALKAQAVAARTFTCYQLLHGDPDHPQADLCADHRCCQAWLSREDRLDQWPEEGREEYGAKITAALRETAGEILLYQGAPALAVFHAASSHSTRSAQAVWGEALPYLVPVSSPEGEEDTPSYYSLEEFSAQEFSHLFLARWPEADLSGPPEGWFSPPETDDSGQPSRFTVGGTEVTAQTLRSLLGLRSASFSVSVEGETITFHVTGYGHGVGMSQYGANTMAGEGQDYRAILAHYYPGTEISAP